MPFVNLPLLTILAEISLATAFLCAVLIVLDLRRHPQEMAVMNIVWPVTALYAGPLALWAYYKIGRHIRQDRKREDPSPKGVSRKEVSPKTPMRPFPQSVLLSTLHCGAGCTLGDLLAEIFLFFIPVFFFGNKVFGNWIIDFIFAFVTGVLFQYYALKPMKEDLSSGAILIKALKADALSLSFWQIGMYGWMALCFFSLFHKVLSAADPVFWLMMQIAMLIGMLTAYPVNWWLLKKGIKERM